MRALMGNLACAALTCLPGCFRGDRDTMRKAEEKSRHNLQELQEAYDRFEKKEPGASAPGDRPRDKN